MYYHFHWDHSHDTEDCKTLKDEMKMLIRRGYLSKYKRDYRVEMPPIREQTKEKQPL